MDRADQGKAERVSGEKGKGAGGLLRSVRMRMCWI